MHVCSMNSNRYATEIRWFCIAYAPLRIIYRAGMHQGGAFSCAWSIRVRSRRAPFAGRLIAHSIGAAEMNAEVFGNK